MSVFFASSPTKIKNVFDEIYGEAAAEIRLVMIENSLSSLQKQH